MGLTPPFRNLPEQGYKADLFITDEAFPKDRTKDQ
jgi:hypothetical protein